MGFRDSGTLRPTFYYGRRHDYVYYPIAWVDPTSGTSYEQGYYDENGRYYGSVSFQENGKYQNVVCRCPYCGTETILTLDNTVGGQQDLNCPGCGAPMEIKSELDEIVAGTGGAVGGYRSYESGASAAYDRASYDPERKDTSRKKAWRFGLFAVILGLLISAGRYFANRAAEPVVIPDEPAVQSVQIVDEPGGVQVLPWEPVYLELQDDGYHVVNDAVRADKLLFWDADADSWYDAESDCWLWYNTDVQPHTWQYWYEGISSDYGDYGWMEHYSDGWFIEESEGNWVSLPDSYGSDRLWYIES